MDSRNSPRAALLDGHLVILAGSFAALFSQLFIKLASGPWQTEQEGHGPFLLAAAILIAYLQFARNRGLLAVARPRFLYGFGVFLGGVLFAVVGESQDITTLAAGSQVVVVAGLLIAYFGFVGIRIMIVPLLLVGAATPPPSYLIDTITVHLKEYISDSVVWSLYHLGFDIAQNGVIIQAGPYELLVKDACAGMNSIFALSALSLIYVYIRSEMPSLQKAMLVLAAFPIAVFANFVRVLVLCLLTFAFGLYFEEGLHEVTGIFLFLVAGLLLLGLDSLLSMLGWIASRRDQRIVAALPSVADGN